MAQAFSHFTFDLAHGELLVVDIQGVPSVDQSGGIALHLTDAQAGPCKGSMASSWVHVPRTGWLLYTRCFRIDFKITLM